MLIVENLKTREEGHDCVKMGKKQQELVAKLSNISGVTYFRVNERDLSFGVRNFLLDC